MINLIDPNSGRPVKNNLAKFSEAELEYWKERKRQCAREWDVLEPIIRNMVDWESNKRSFPQASTHSRIREDFRGDPGGGNAENEPHDEDDPRDHREKQSESSSTASKIKYTIWTPSQICALKFNPDDIIIDNGYIEKGASSVWCGPAGIGKSRLTLQLAFCCALNQGFISWKTNGADLKWLFLQTENGTRRLQSDLSAMRKDLTSLQCQRLDERVFIHVLENDNDGFMRLDNDKVIVGLEECIVEYAPDVIVWDPLRDFNIGNIDGDTDMASTLSTVSRLTRLKNPRRIPIVLHHALTGRLGSSKAVGYERSSFGRNSKVLMAWGRSQVNWAPYNEDNNETLVVASGKCNNFAEFEPFAITLDTTTMTYARDDTVDLDAWREAMSGKSSGNGSKRKITGEELFEKVIPQFDKIMESELVRAVQGNGYARDPARDIVKEWIEKSKVFKHPVPGSKAIWLGRDKPIPATGGDNAKADGKPKKEDILALIPAECSINQDAVLSKAADLNPPIGERRARGFIAELKSDNVIFEWLIPRRGSGSVRHLSRSEQPTSKESAK